MSLGPCVGCGATNYAASYGGPSLCPSCDCGIDPETNRLRMALAEARIEVARLSVEAARIRAEALEEAAKVIPTSWLDPRLTGLGGMGQPPYSCADIERLLMGIGSAIRVLVPPAGEKT